MIRNYIVKTAALVMLMGLGAGAVGQAELMKPGISFLSPSLWPHILTLHIWASAISLIVICASTISLIRDRTTLGQWAIWLGFAAVPLLFGLMTSLMLKNIQSPDSAFMDTVYITANRHAYGTAGLLIALGGLSALQRTKFKGLPLKISFAFASLITISGVSLAFQQALLGLNSLPRQYLDYPQEYAQWQFNASIAAMACFSFSAIYVILLWRWSGKKAGRIDEMF